MATWARDGGCLHVGDARERPLDWRGRPGYLAISSSRAQAVVTKGTYLPLTLPPPQPPSSGNPQGLGMEGRLPSRWREP